MSLTAHEEAQRTKGKGLNSIPIRFALMVGVFTTMCTFAQFYYFNPFSSGESKSVILTIIAATIIIPSVITFFAANKLANAIRALKMSTEAIIGRHEQPG